jgi:hypothetical protein
MRKSATAADVKEEARTWRGILLSPREITVIVVTIVIRFKIGQAETAVTAAKRDVGELWWTSASRSRVRLTEWEILRAIEEDLCLIDLCGCHGCWDRMGVLSLDPSVLDLTRRWDGGVGRRGSMGRGSMLDLLRYDLRVVIRLLVVIELRMIVSGPEGLGRLESVDLLLRGLDVLGTRWESRRVRDSGLVDVLR